MVNSIKKIKYIFSKYGLAADGVHKEPSSYYNLYLKCNGCKLPNNKIVEWLEWSKTYNIQFCIKDLLTGDLFLRDQFYMSNFEINIIVNHLKKVRILP